MLRNVWLEGTPLIEDDRAIFVWYGNDPPVLRGDFNGWRADEGPSWEPAAESPDLTSAAVSVWKVELILPRDAYIEYCLGPDGDRVTDPFNKRRISNGLGEMNHFFYMPDGAPTTLVKRGRKVLRGPLTRHQLPADRLVTGQRRTVYLYQPPTPEPCPLLVVLDGNDYNRRAKLPTMMDNLIAQKRVAPMALAMVAHGRNSRYVEYTCSEATLAFLVERVIPLARANLNLIDVRDVPGAYGVLGASMGGLMALFAGLRLSGIFGSVLCQSGVFHRAGYSSVVNDLVRWGEVKPLQIWMDAGHFDPSLESCRRLVALLQDRRYEVSYHEHNSGHNYTAWRNHIWRGLEELFPWIQS